MTRVPILLVALFFCSVLFSQSDCSKFRVGVYQNFKDDIPLSIIERNDSIQIETIGEKRVILKVNWIDSCSYRLSFTEGNDAWWNGREKGKSTPDLIVRIAEAYGIYSNKLASSANQTLNADFTFGDWYNNVGSGIWDLKNNKSTIWGVAWAFSEANKAATGKVKNTQFVTPNLTFEDASDFGNYHAGFTGSMFGVPVAFQKIGAGAVEQLKDLKAGEFMQVASQYWQMGKFWERNAFMDETDDHYWNTQGMSDALFLKKKLNLGPNNLLGVEKQ